MFIEINIRVLNSLQHQVFSLLLCLLHLFFGCVLCQEKSAEISLEDFIACDKYVTSPTEISDNIGWNITSITNRRSQ